jgi:hypothetical protein
MVRAAVALAGLMLATPAVAQAAPPTCKDAEFTIFPNASLPLPQPSCTDPEGDAFLIAGYTTPAHGTINPGAMTYTPTPGYHGYDQFTFQVRDNNNETSLPARVSLLIDTAPQCRDGSATVVSGQMLVLPDLPCNDPNDDFIDIYVGDPAHGTVAFPPDGSVVYTPAPGYVGPDAFTYSAVDEFGLESYVERTMTITVTPAPPAVPVPTVAPPPPSPPKDLSAPVFALKNAGKKQALAITVTTNENASATLTAALDKATAKKLKLGRTVGTLKAALTPGASTLKLKLSARAAKAFKKLKTVKLTVTAVIADASGNVATKTLKVTLKK